jgi:hypothetical protein
MTMIYPVLCFVGIVTCPRLTLAIILFTLDYTFLGFAALFSIFLNDD